MTVTHTIGVFALGLVTLALSQFIVPDRLYPWLNLASGLLVVGIGATVLRARAGGAATRTRTTTTTTTTTTSHGSTEPPLAARRRRLRRAAALPVGARRPARRDLAAPRRFGLLLILAFSAGLALTITGIGLVAVLARSAFRRCRFEGRLVRLLPAASALVILAAGLAMTLRAVPKVS